MAVNLECILAAGLKAQHTRTEREQIDQCVSALKSVLSTVPKELGLVAYMEFSCDLMDRVKK